MKITLIAAVDRNNVIGHENDLPWYLPEDLKRFKKLTAGKTVLMGRKTFESILKRLGKPLPGRKNVVVTHNRGYKIPADVFLYYSLEEALEALKNESEIFVIGGGEIFRQTISSADLLFITHVDMDAPGNIFFPKIDPAVWEKTEEEPHENYSFATYQRRHKQNP